ncbi:MAG: hypothetical protein M3R48_01225 [Candidatus Dormibacteraeota bacterium]|nr:hypothetical protein [Candidatus Dormibacteraeota bacterium]
MSTARTLKQRGVKLARTASNPSHRLPRRGYAHCFIEDRGVHSRLHLHHFYSLFLPDIADPVETTVHVFNAEGRRLGSVRRTLDPFTSLVLRMADVLEELGAMAAYGTVAVDVAPSATCWQRLVEVGPPNAIAQSPFWMGFVDDGGSVAYVHSIDQFYGAVFGVGRVAGVAYRGGWHRGGAWTSKRLIDAHGLVSADAYLVNHSPRAGRTAVRWLSHPEGAVVAEKTVTVQAHGAARVAAGVAELERAGTAVDRLRLEVDELLTANGKPYVMVRYRDGPFSLHHG